MQKIVWPVVGIFLFGAACVAMHAPAHAQDSNTQKPTAANEVTVGVFPFPPLVQETSDGTLQGYDIDVLNAISEKTGIAIDVQKAEKFEDLFTGLQNQKYDAAMAGITMTAKREHFVDYTYTYYRSGLTVAHLSDVVDYDEFGLMSIFGGALTGKFWWNLLKASFFLLLASIFFSRVIGLPIWLAERFRNQQFDKDLGGWSDATWYVYMLQTTIGLGDRFAVTWLGRVLSMWAGQVGGIVNGAIGTVAAAIIIIPSVTGGMSDLSDLENKRVATVSGTTSVAALQSVKAKPVLTPNVEAALAKLERRAVDAVVFDAPALQHYVKEHPEGEVVVSDTVFNPEDYAIALQPNSPHREAFNQAILELKGSKQLAEIHERWFGAAAE